ncbi:MAG: hypothetical protein AAFY41_07525 [Bacteroidota bacterium]
MLACFLKSASGLDRESAAERGLCGLEISACGIFSLQNAVPSTNFGSTGRLHYFSAVHKVRAHASYMDVTHNNLQNLRLTFIIAVFGLLSCQSRTNSQNSEQTTEFQEPDSIETNLETQQQKLTELEPDSTSDKSQLPSGLAVLGDFKQNAENRSNKVNDSLFVEFLKSFTTYQNSMNDLLFDDPMYDTYNTLVYADDNLVDPKAREFEDSVQTMGFYISTSEGMIFLEKDPQFLEKFSNYLSERMNTFRIQYSKEIQYPLAEDGGIIISTDEHIKRMLFWEKFAKNNTDFELPDYANDQFEMYLFYLMFGMDNTPIHDWSDSLKIRPEVVETYNNIIDRFPNSDAVSYLTDYLNYLEQKNFKYDRSFDEYGRQKFPEMYGN